MQWRKHVRIKYGGRVGVGQGQREREQVQLQVRVVQLQREGGARLSYVCHQPQLSSTARRSCSAAAMLCCGRRKVSKKHRSTLQDCMLVATATPLVLQPRKPALHGTVGSHPRLMELRSSPELIASKWSRFSRLPLEHPNCLRLRIILVTYNEIYELRRSKIKET